MGSGPALLDRGLAPVCCLPGSSQLRPVRGPEVNAGAGRAEHRPHRPPVQVPSTVPRPARMGHLVSQQRRCSLATNPLSQIFSFDPHGDPVRLGPRTHGFCHCFPSTPCRPGMERASEGEPQDPPPGLASCFTCSHLVRWLHLFTSCQVAPWLKTLLIDCWSMLICPSLVLSDTVMNQS